MITTQQLPDTFTDSASSQHPLEPLTAEEVATAVALVRANHNFGEKIRFPMVVLVGKRGSFALGLPLKRICVTIENAVCLHEEDYGILWKHMDWRTEHTEVRRSRPSAERPDSSTLL